MNQASVITNHHGPAQHQRRSQFSVLQSVGGPQTCTVRTTPRHDRSVTFSTKNSVVVAMNTMRSTGLLHPLYRTPARIHTTNSYLKSTGTHRAANSTDRSHKLYKTLDIIGTPWTGQRRLPANNPIIRIQADQPP